jgi:hypothetical protein
MCGVIAGAVRPSRIAMHLYMCTSSKRMRGAIRGQKGLLETKGNMPFKSVLRGVEGGSGATGV